jgi:sulfur carrier protein ThiS adenylyltransferase
MCPSDNTRNLEALLFSRQPAAVTERLRGACIGVAGCGGLGSVVAENLARAGIGKLVIADCDVVEPSNLNRQRYFVSQIGMAKVEALRDNLQQANPFVEIVPVREKVTAANCALFFSACAVVAECFDNPVSKAALVTGLRKNIPGCVVVAASGLAGTGDGNAIKTRKVSDRFFVVGDMLADADAGIGLFAARVGIAASMQAHLIIRLIAGEHV